MRSLNEPISLWRLVRIHSLTQFPCKTSSKLGGDTYKNVSCYSSFLECLISGSYASIGDVQHMHSRIQTAPIALRLRRFNAFQFFSYSWINAVIFFLLKCPVKVATVSWTDKPKGRLKQHSLQTNINTENAERTKHTYVCLVNLCLLPFCLVFWLSALAQQIFCSV